jgi:serine kinase of HPr protein (carbohydrate metabolism regulator)
MKAQDTVHASVVALDGHGILIRGASGSGKSSLLLSLLDGSPAAATLVADDRAHVTVEGDRILASVPEAIAGKLEIRGIGIVQRSYVASVAVDLVVDLLPLEECPRMPSEEESQVILEGVALPRIFVATGAHDGAARVRAALDRRANGNPH